MTEAPAFTTATASAISSGVTGTYRGRLGFHKVPAPECRGDDEFLPIVISS